MKTEPTSFSIQDLKRVGVEPWDGVRNALASKYLRTMKLGERAFFYHSSCEVPGIAGVCEIEREAYPDHTQFDPESKYFDPRSSRERPRWMMPDVRFVEEFKQLIPLIELRNNPELEGMILLRKGQRLSVMPVTPKEFKVILKMAQ